jgi:LuxR family maltose regulon positive regulatory protein
MRPGLADAKGSREMDDVLITKLSAPLPRHRLVSRDRLLDQLSREGLHSRLILVSAPAGFGKTTLLSTWRTANAGQCDMAWVALDEYDSDPARFWRHVIASIENALSRPADEARAALQGAMPQIQSAMAGLINAIAAHPRPLLVVLDEYQWITAPAVHESVAYLLDHLPVHAHVAMLTRADPPFGLARLRVRGELCELRAAQLRFTPEETRAFLREVMGIHLSEEALSVVQTRTEGWPAAVHLAAQVAKGAAPAQVSAHLITLLHAEEFIFDYLAEEVIRQQSPEVQHFLLHTCVLSHLNISLCDAMTGQDNAALILSRLQHDDFFISLLDADEGWYRYHPLYAQALQVLLRQKSPALLRELHARASDWHYSHDHLFEAIRHAQAIHDNERITRYIGDSYRRLIMQGDIVTVMRLLDALPAERVRSNARLAIAYAWSHIYAMQFGKLERYLSLALSAAEAETSDEQRMHVRAEVMALRAVYESVYGDAGKAMTLSHEAAAIADPDDALLQMVLGVSYGNAYRARGQVNEALRSYEATVRLGQSEGHYTLASLGEVRLSQMMLAAGRLHDARARLQAIADSHLSIRGEPVLFAAETLLLLGGTHYELNELSAAMDCISRGIEAAEITSNSVALIYNTVPAVQTLLACRSQREAQAFIERVAGLASHMQSPAPAAIADAHRAWFQCLTGQHLQAAAWAEHYATEAGRAALLALFRDEADQAQALVCAAQGKWQQAARVLRTLMEDAQAAGRARTVMAARVQLALLLETTGQHEPARAELLRALAMAEHEGCIRTFIHWGEPMHRLLMAVRGRAGDVLHDYIERLLDAFPLEQRGADTLIEPLTAREMEILQMLACGSTNADIAGRLIISTGTVKAHTNRIFGKLGVRNRTEAAARARALHLLAAGL